MKRRVLKRRSTPERDERVAQTKKRLDPAKEQFAFEHADQWLGCVACGVSRHATNFCAKCGACYFCLLERGRVEHAGEYTLVFCSCGDTLIWD
jgi:hypothetical protein